MVFLFYRGNNKKWFFIFLVLIAITSFWFAEWFYDTSQKFTYYMLPSRVGEFIIGILAAQIVYNYGHIKIPDKFSLLASIVGCTLLFYSSMFLSPKNVIPGYVVIIPTIGTALVILGGHYGSNLIAKFLALKPFTELAKISYSVYLWHWPLLVIYRYANYEITLLSGATIFLLILIVSWLSYRYVEQPFRNTNKPSMKIFMQYLILPIIAFLTIIFVFRMMEGYGLRGVISNYKSRGNILENNTTIYKDKICQEKIVNEALITKKTCVLGDDKSPTKVLLWGDSNAAHLTGLIEAFAQKGNFRFRNVAHFLCPPVTITDPKNFLKIGSHRVNCCRESLQFMKDKIKEYSVIIIGGRWDRYVQRTHSRFYAMLFKQIKDLTNAGKTVIIVGASPRYNGYNIDCARKALSLPFMKCHKTFPLDKKIIDVNKKLKEFASLNKNVAYYSFNSYLCQEGSCSTFIKDGANKIHVAYDKTHLAYKGMYKLGEIIIKQEGGIPLPFRNIPEWVSSSAP